MRETQTFDLEWIERGAVEHQRSLKCYFPTAQEQPMQQQLRQVGILTENNPKPWKTTALPQNTNIQSKNTASKTRREHAYGLLCFEKSSLP